MTQTQVSLDRCTGQFIIQARAASLSMEASYRRFEGYRKAAMLACASVALCPEAAALFREAATLEEAIETGIEKYWQEQQGVWQHEAANRCNLGWGLRSGTYPDFPYPIVSPALLFEEHRAEIFLKIPPPALTLELEVRKLKSIAKLERKHSGEWNIRWTE